MCHKNKYKSHCIDSWVSYLIPRHFLKPLVKFSCHLKGIWIFQKTFSSIIHLLIAVNSGGIECVFKGGSYVHGSLVSKSRNTAVSLIFVLEIKRWEENVIDCVKISLMSGQHEFYLVLFGVCFLCKELKRGLCFLWLLVNQVGTWLEMNLSP